MRTPVDISTLRFGDRFSFNSASGPVYTLVRFERGYEYNEDGYDEPGYEIQWTDEGGTRFSAWEGGQLTAFVYPRP